MPIRVLPGLLVALLLICIGPAAAASDTAGQTRHLLSVTALDRIFVTFSESVLAQAKDEQISVDQHFLTQWTEAASLSFAPERLDAALVAALSGRMAPSETEAIGGFFGTPLGLSISATESQMAELGASDLTAALSTGRDLLTSGDTTRRDILALLADLPATEISRVMIQQTVRATLVGLSLAGRTDGASPPWAEIDAQVAALEPSLNAQLLADQQSLMAYAYRDLSTRELETYLDFLKTSSAQHFYAEVAYAVRRIVSEGMKHFGETLASRLASVSI